MRRKSVIIVFLVSSRILFTLLNNIAAASSGEWIEITRFNQNSRFLHETFTIEHVEWRIKWEYEPTPEIPKEQPALYVYVWDQEFPDKYFETIQKKGSHETRGILYIHNRSGTFSLGVIRTIPRFQLRIEQDITSIPEFQSWIILPVFIVISSLGLFHRNRGII